MCPDIMTEAELRRRGRLLFTVLTVLGLRWSSREPELVLALRGWLGSWAGIRHVAGGMARQGYDVQLTRHGEAGWRATFYPSGKEHSIVAGTAWELTAGRAIQVAAWRALHTHGPLMGW